MKSPIIYMLLTLLLAAPFAAQAQKAPYELMINGVKVIVRPSGNDIVVIQTGIKGGVQNYTAAKAGIESLAINALTECGTVQDDKNSFKNKLDKVSANVGGYTGLDYASFNLNCIKTDLATVWPLYTAALLTPRFDEQEFARIKQDQLTSIRDAEGNPDAAINRLAQQTAFNGKKYAIDPTGTESSVSKLTAAEVKAYWKSTFNRGRLVIVVVADLEKAEIEQMMKGFLDRVPAGIKFTPKKEAYVPASTSFKAVERENATNYVQGIAGAPLPGTADYNAYVLAMSIFSNRHFIEIRTKNGLSYAPGAWFSPGFTTSSNLYVTTTEPDKYIAVARQLIDKVKKDGFTASELKNEKTGYLTGLYYRQETNESQAASFLANEVVHGNWRRSMTIKDDIDKVTLPQLNAAFSKYMTNITWVYQGDPKKVNPVLYTQKQTPAVPVEKKAF